jgi:hypothetical protein
MAKLENVMYNFMGCNQMMFGSKVRYSVTYKTNQRSFDVFRRKYIHDFKVPMCQENFEGALTLELPKVNCFLVARVDKVMMFDSENFLVFDEIPIKLMPADTREAN